jgi:hypothetical protein
MIPAPNPAPGAFTTVQVDGKTFAIGKMTPREQQHVLRRLAPLFAQVAPAAMALLDEKANKAVVFQQIAAAIGPFTVVLASMKDEDYNYVMDSCLVRVAYQDPTDNAFHPVYTATGANGLLPMYADLVDGQLELKLAAEVIKLNMKPFFSQLSGGTAPSLSSQ